MKKYNNMTLAVVVLAVCMSAIFDIYTPKKAEPKRYSRLAPAVSTKTVTTPNQTVFFTKDILKTPVVTPKQLPPPPYADADAELLAKILWTEARGLSSKMEQAAVVWCVLNRLDSGDWGDTIEDVITAKNQFAYRKSTAVRDDLKALALDVLDRWWREQNGETDVGRVLPPRYIYFSGNGKRNRFRSSTKGDCWNWSLDDPYEAAIDENTDAML